MTINGVDIRGQRIISDSIINCWHYRILADTAVEILYTLSVLSSSQPLKIYENVHPDFAPAILRSGHIVTARLTLWKVRSRV